MLGCFENIGGVKLKQLLNTGEIQGCAHKARTRAMRSHKTQYSCIYQVQLGKSNKIGEGHKSLT